MEPATVEQPAMDSKVEQPAIESKVEPTRKRGRAEESNTVLQSDVIERVIQGEIEQFDSAETSIYQCLCRVRRMKKSEKGVDPSVWAVWDTGLEGLLFSNNIDSLRGFVFAFEKVVCTGIVSKDDEDRFSSKVFALTRKLRIIHTASLEIAAKLHFEGVERKEE